MKALFKNKELNEAVYMFLGCLINSFKLTVWFCVCGLLYLVVLDHTPLSHIDFDYVGGIVMIVWGSIVSYTTIKKYETFTK